ncbi:hypothetical protein CC1G_04101 [Coprinopsis cinerea okayama7|uniref:Uncharacterized protein n=1 Tax=Coprinopsis cinerea (strain Okayama-7 / 130 / ATCC MYA-4618 / FGSC 9003) TaxID=240176 RepID=A8NVZ6_COPC7|nr:hypothetical protein CC1G_04101 [Coprinopsis cinerea okayama7\|eukprot:XP_001836788.2 hypothetical protein CC1G_04101 [Coprinopsis cinerea okayama7\
MKTTPSKARRNVAGAPYRLHRTLPKLPPVLDAVMPIATQDTSPAPEIGNQTLDGSSALIPSASTSIINCLRRKLRGSNTMYTCYQVENSSQSFHPSQIQSVKPSEGDVFVHTLTPGGLNSVWTWSQETWTVITQGGKHPSLANYVFSMEKGAGWVTVKSYNTYQTRGLRRASLPSTSSGGMGLSTMSI